MQLQSEPIDALLSMADRVKLMQLQWMMLVAFRKNATNESINFDPKARSSEKRHQSKLYAD